MAMRSTCATRLPNATFVAFTGTPVSLDDRDTRAVFGDYVHIYDIEQAVKDGATVPIYYESRLAKLELKEADVTLLDSEVDELTEDEEDDAAKVAKLRRWAALEQLVGAPPRIQQVAADIVEHFENRLTAMDGKAMVVAMSREICVHLYDAIVALRPDWHSDDPEQGAIKVVMTGSACDKALLKPAHLPQGRAQAPGKALQEPGRPVQARHRARHVADRLRRALRAHDVRGQADERPQPDAGHRPREPRLQGQAGRPGGGLHRHRQRAEGGAGRLHRQPKGAAARPSTRTRRSPCWQEKMDVLRDMLHGVDYGDFRTRAWQLLPAVPNHVLGLDDGKKRFADTVLACQQGLHAVLHAGRGHGRTRRAGLPAGGEGGSDQARRHRQEADRRAEGARAAADHQPAVVSDEVVDIFSAAGLTSPDIGVLSDEFLEDVRHMKERNLAVELLERLLKGEIKSRFKTNVVQSAKFSELLQQSLTRYRNRAIETAQVIEELIEMAKKFQEAAQRGESSG